MTMTLISAADLATHLGAADVRVFDVRHDLTNHAAGREAYATGHIPGARYLDHETELAAPDRQEWPPSAARPRPVRRLDGGARRHARNPGGGL